MFTGIRAAANFSTWPIELDLQNLLNARPVVWEGYFLSEDDRFMVYALNGLAVQIENVNFSVYPENVEQFFRFLTRFVKSQPRKTDVFQALNQLVEQIFNKIRSQFDCVLGETPLVVHCLDLLSRMLEPRHRYLFDHKEMTLVAEDLQAVSARPSIMFCHSHDVLSSFLRTLRRSSKCPRFLDDHPALIETILNLARWTNVLDTGLDKLSVMQLFDALGFLSYSLNAAIPQRTHAASIKIASQSLYNLSESAFRDNDLLKFVFYKLFLRQSYKHSDSELVQRYCRADYSAYCQSDYIRYHEKHHCPPAALAQFSVRIEHNDLSAVSLGQTCERLRQVEMFVPWMQDLGFVPRHKTSQFILRLSASKQDYLIDRFLFEHYAPEPSVSNHIAWYVQKKQQQRYLLGRAYGYSTLPDVIRHEYVYHLHALFLENLEFDLTITEGIAELFAGGICHARHLHELKYSVNDTYIFDFLQHRVFPFYTNAFKWVAYLVNQHPLFYQQIGVSALEGNQTAYDAKLAFFIGNISNINDFTTWAHQQVEVCSRYLASNPDAELSLQSTIYLDAVKQLVIDSAGPALQTAVSPLLEKVLMRRDAGDFYPGLEGLHVLATNVSEARSAHHPTKEQHLSAVLKLIIPLSTSAVLTGFLSAGLTHMSETNKKDYPYLIPILTYGVKPVLFSVVSAGCNVLSLGPVRGMTDSLMSVAPYLMTNYVGLFLGQALNQKIAEKINNRLLCFFLQSLIWMFLWNPGLFLSDAFAANIVPMLCMQVAQGVLFKAGEEGYKFSRNACSYSGSFWSTQEDMSFEKSTAASDETTVEIAALR